MTTITIPPYTKLPTPAVERTFMSIPKKILLCLPLRTGCLLMGYVTLIYTILEVLIDVGILFVGFYFHSDEFAKTPLPVMMPFILTMFVPLVAISIPWIGINITGIIGIHKDRPVHGSLFTKYLTVRLLYTVVFTVFSFFVSDIIHQYFVAISIGTMLSTYYVMIYYWYTTELDSKRKTKNEPYSEKASKPNYLSENIDRNKY